MKIPEDYRRTIRALDDPEHLKAWRDFTQTYWDEPGHTLSGDAERQLFEAGFLRSRGVLYQFDGQPRYLSDFQAQLLDTANGQYRPVVTDRVLFSHVMSNYCSTPEVYAIVSAEDIQWISSPWWELPDAPDGHLVLQPMHADAGFHYEIITLREGRYLMGGHEGDVSGLLQHVQQLAHRHNVPFLLEACPIQGSFAQELAPEGLSLLTVLLARERTEWRPHLAGAVMVIPVQQADGQLATTVESGALTAWVNTDSGALSRCKGLGPDGRLANYTRHPQTDEPILGKGIPDWPAIRDMLMQFFDESSYLRSCAIAFTLSEHGPAYFSTSERHLAALQVHKPLLADQVIRSHIRRVHL